MKEKRVLFKSTSDLETINLGKGLGSVLSGGDVVALVGELGSGKTWFTKGLAQGLGIPAETVITSPTFSLVNEYSGRHTLFHIDAYRLESLEDFFSAGLDEYLYKDGVVVMEWADRWPEILPPSRLKVEIMITDERTRQFALSGHHQRAYEILNRMEQDA